MLTTRSLVSMAAMSVRPPAFVAALCTLALVTGAAGGAEDDRVVRTEEPFFMDPGSFLDKVQKEEGDILLLLYGPTCPDCEWFMGRWARVAARLERVPSMAVWTVADPALQAPSPFTHKHLPAIFFIPATKKSHPTMLSEKLLGPYLDGKFEPSKTWQEQDDDFEASLLDFAGTRASSDLTVVTSPKKKAWRAQRDLEKLAAKEWGQLYGDGAKKVFEKKIVSALKTKAKVKAVQPPSPPRDSLALPGTPPARPRGGFCDRSCEEPSHPLQALRLRAVRGLAPPALGAEMERKLEQLVAAPMAPARGAQPDPSGVLGQ